MDQREINIHLLAGRIAGYQSTCLSQRTGQPKITHPTEYAAAKAAASLTRANLSAPKEAYPCFYCSPRLASGYAWHVGSVMTAEWRAGVERMITYNTDDNWVWYVTSGDEQVTGDSEQHDHEDLALFAAWRLLNRQETPVDVYITRPDQTRHLVPVYDIKLTKEVLHG